MHCHIKDHLAPFFLAAGVTTVRNTSGSLRELDGLRTAPPDAPAPRVISAGRMIEGTGLGIPTSPWAFITDDPAVAREEARVQCVDEGADLVKVYGHLPADAMLAVVEEAASHGVPVSCDLMYGTEVTIRTAARAGVRWCEHALGFAQALYPGYAFKGGEDSWARVPWEDPDSPALDALCAELVDLGLLLCPTMTLLDQCRRGSEPWWPEGALGRAPAAALAKLGRLSRFNQATARAYRRAGGVVVAGTDTPAGVWNGMGIALHRELELFVELGWSPMEALQAATSTAARALGRDDLGVIRPGAAGDLVVLQGDPLADIRSTLAIETVVKSGRFFRPDDLLGNVPPLEEILARHERLMADFARDGR